MRSLLLVLTLVCPLLTSGCAALLIGGAGAGVMAAEDRRTLGTITEDQGIESRVANTVGERHKDERVHVNVTSYNRMVLLTGEVPSEEVKRDVERIAHATQNVRAVTNELAVGAPSSLTARANDSYITSKVKARFVDAQRFNALHVKVITENQVVYLLGLVGPQEAKDAAAIARTTEGVKKVVTVFESRI